MHPAILLVLLILGVLLGLEFWALFSKASKTASGVALAGVLVFGGLASWMWISLGLRSQLVLSEYYGFEVALPGKKVLRIRTIPGVPGMNASFVPKGTRGKRIGFGEVALPVEMAAIRACGWRVLNPDLGIHLHDEVCDCSPKWYLFDTGFSRKFEDGTVQGVEVEYRVDDVTRPILEVLDLRVSYPGTFGNDLAFSNAANSIVGIMATGAALLGCAAFVVQRRRLRPATTLVNASGKGTG